jgi:hypothetical protein
MQTSALSIAGSTDQTASCPIGLSSKPKQSLAVHSAIGTLDLRTPAEEIEFQECQRWGFGRAQASRYIAAGEIQRSLAAVPGMPVPECEAQIRPLIGLSADQAQTA